MKIKVLALSLVMFISAILTGCAYDDYENNLKLFNDFVNKILYFYQGNTGGNPNDSTETEIPDNGDNNGGEDNENSDEEQEEQPVDFLTQFKSLIDQGKSFVFTRTIQTEYYTTQEEIYFLGNYIYKVTDNSSIVESNSFIMKI